MKILAKFGPKRERSLWWYAGSAAMTLLSLAIIARLVSKNLDALLTIRQTWILWPLVLTFPVFCAGELVGSLAWGRIMNDIARPLRMSQHQAIFMVTHAARRLPGSVWHIVGRIAWYEQLGIGKGLTTFGNILENVLVLWSGLALSLVFIPFRIPERQEQLPWFVLGVAATAALMHPRLLRWMLQRLGQKEGLEKITYRRVLTWLLYYLVLWLVGGTILFLTLKSILAIDNRLWPLCVAAWCITGVLGTLILIVPSGLGLQEASLSLILSTVVPSSIAVAAAILMRILLTVFELLFALVVFLLRGSSDLQRAAVSEQAAQAPPKND